MNKETVFSYESLSDPVSVLNYYSISTRRELVERLTASGRTGRPGEPMTGVEIEYCVPCGHLDRAIETQRAILSSFERDLERAVLRTGDGGVFVVSVDGEAVYDAREEGYDLAAIQETVGERIDASD